MKKDRILNMDQAAELLSISRRSLYRRIAAGDFAVFKVGRSLRVRESNIQAYIDRRISLYAVENGICVPGDDS